MTAKIARFLYKYHVLSVFCGLFIIFLCLIRIPVQDVPMNIPYFDKIVHFLMYLFLGSAYLFESLYGKKTDFLQTCLKNLLYCGLMAGAIELAQMYLTSYRSGEWMDWYCGLAGALTSCAVGALFRLAFRSPGR